MSLLLIDQVTKTFEKTTAVKGISLAVPEQTIFGLLGPNGAGKTTLIRMITNIFVQDSGTITLHGIPKGMKRNMFIGYMPEERGLYKKMKIGEQLMYLAQLKNLSKKQAKENIDYWLTKFEITDWWNKKVEELSKGMQQKIQFIATVIHDPKLIILDEPFSGLDPINANLIKDEIFELRQKGATVLFSTHRMEQVEEICEEIALINKGEIILQGGVKDLKQRFKKHLFEVDYIGQLPDLKETVFKLVEQTDHQLVLNLQEGHTANDLLHDLIKQQVQVHAFHEILPSLNELFINQVNQRNREVSSGV